MPRHFACACALAALLLPAAAAPVAAQTAHRLERAWVVGARAKVDEERTSRVSYTWKNAAGAGTRAVASKLSQRYQEEVRRDRPLVLWREYERSLKEEGAPGARVEPERTSLHGRRVLVTGLALQPEGPPPFEVSKHDRETLRFDRLAHALLPAAAVKVSQSWTVPAGPLVAALFGEHVGPANQRGGARVTLQRLTKVKGEDQATLSATIDVGILKSEGLPELSLKLKGSLKLGLKEGVLLQAQLQGTMHLVMTHDGNRVEGDGPLAWTYEATHLPAKAAPRPEAREGAPPPREAKALVCPTDKNHRFEIQYHACCTVCGERLDAERRCPKKHPWALQRCPYDGAALEAK